MLLWDCDKRSYSFYIETSVDRSNWDRIIDFTKYRCRSWQFLYFPSHAVRYIKVVGTHNTDHKVFHIVALEAYYTAKIPALVNGLVSPTYNVATANYGAVVIKGANPKALLNGNTQNDDGQAGFTHHNIGNENNYFVFITIFV